MYWGIKLIWVLTVDAGQRVFCPPLPYMLGQQRMSCWLYGDAVISAGVGLCGNIVVYLQDISQGHVEMCVHDGKNVF